MLHQFVRFYLHWFVATGVILLTISSINAQDSATQGAPAGMLTVGSKAPSIDVEHWLSDGNGKFKPVTEFESGKVYVVEFWATWCGPCISSMPHLAELQTTYADRGVQIVSISDEDIGTVKGFLKREVPGEGSEAEEEAKAEDEEEGEEEAEKKPSTTYANVTSAYCLTTDPDRSVHKDYMEAAGQNGIPTSFIVGKTGQIEWIGHPMSMDEPLEKIVADTWDREAFRVEFKKRQDRELLKTAIMKKLRIGDDESAMELIADAKADAEGDAEATAMLEELELNVLVAPAMAKVRSGKTQDGLQALGDVMKKVSPSQKTILLTFKFQLLMQVNEFDNAADTFIQISNSKNADPNMLNTIAVNIYEAAKAEKEFPPVLVAAAITVAETLNERLPGNPGVLSTLARLVSLSGDFDRAIEIQSQATENPGNYKEQMQSLLDELKAAKEAAAK